MLRRHLNWTRNEIQVLRNVIMESKGNS